MCAITGVPLYNLAMSSIAAHLLASGNTEKAHQKLHAKVTRAELAVMNKLGLENVY